MKHQISKSLAGVTGLKQEEIYLETPGNEEFGDYSSNIAMTIFSKLQITNDKSQTNFKLQKNLKSKILNLKSPHELAEKIVDKLKSDKQLMEVVDQIQVAGPGFINFWLKKETLVGSLIYIVNDKDSYGKSDFGKGQKVMVEFAHPNTHKAFHIGHMRNISIGESIVRLLEKTGYEVVRANYQGDVGMHIAKAMYGIIDIPGNKDKLDSLKEVHERVEFLGKAYAAGSKAYEEDDKAKAVIHDYNYLVYASAQRFQEEKGKIKGSTDYLSFVKGKEEKLDEVYEIWKETRKWSLDYFETVYKRVGSHFQRYYFESECLTGVDLAKEAVEKGVLKKSEGAIIFDGESYGLDNRVFVNSLGLPTYEAKELALAAMETSEFGRLDKIIHVVGPEQSSFFKVTFKVEELLDKDRYKDKQYHLVYGWVRLKHGKMASRLGNVVLGEDLLDYSKKEIAKILEKSSYDKKDKEEIAEQAAVGAVKYSFLKPSTLSEIAFDIKESVSLEGNSGPYLQYTYARTQSVLQKAKSIKHSALSFKLNNEEAKLLRQFIHFREVVEEAAKNYSPNLICNYLFDLAQRYNNFYNMHKILGSDEENLRLALTNACGQILKNGLDLLGIQTPERM